MLSTVILRTASRLLVPLSLAFAVFVYFKGHQTPGGGFVAGLVTAVALIVHRMAEGGTSLSIIVRNGYRIIIAMGLLFALLAGVGALVLPLLLGKPMLPFLTSNNGYLPLPGGEPFHWASVMLFDLGVFLAVAGVVVAMIDALSREVE